MTLTGYGLWWWTGQPDRDIVNVCTGKSRERLSQAISGAQLSSSSPYPSPGSSVLGYNCSAIDDPDDSVLIQGYISTFRRDSRRQQEWADNFVEDQCEDTGATLLTTKDLTLPETDRSCVTATKEDDSALDEEPYTIKIGIVAQYGVDVIKIRYSEYPGGNISAMSKTAEKIATIVIEALEDGDGD